MENSIPVKFNTLPQVIEELKEYADHFTQAMLETYKMQADTPPEDFILLRSLIVKDSLLYFKKVAPQSAKIFQNVFSTFDLMGDIDSIESFEECVEYFSHQLKNLKEQINLCEGLHKLIIQSFSANKIIASNVSKALTNDKEKEISEESRCHELQEKAQAKADKKGFFESLTKSKQKMANKLANQLQGMRHHILILELYIGQIEERIIPAIECFLEQLGKLEEIITLFALELKNLSTNTEKFEKTKANVFYKASRNNCNRIKTNCNHVKAYFLICESKVEAMEEFEKMSDASFSDFLKKYGEKNGKRTVKEDVETLIARLQVLEKALDEN